MTSFNPDTLDAYIEKYGGLVDYLAPGSTGTPPSDVPPAEQTSKAISLQVRWLSCQGLSTAKPLQTGVVMDNPPPGRKFGDVLIAPLATYKAGDSVAAQFVAANPRVSSDARCLRVCVDAWWLQNNLRLEQTFLTVDRLQNDVWAPVRSDSHPSTKFEWLRTNGFAGHSTVNITW